ncbi:MAG TPA: SHOCT domain-containing protein [Acidimicrobiia bacterium]|nr:SHOCT domain-containing protein [Acidimicrobiia bacterium]
MTTLLATIAADHWGHGPGWWVLIPLLFWGTLVFLLATRIRHWRRFGPFGPGWRSGEAVLAERYARGEIDADEYRNRLTVLREQGK